MAKGRRSNPSTESIGNWYKHKNCQDYLKVGSRLDVTSTGHMLDHTKEYRKSVPSAPPQTFAKKSLDIYEQSNPFSTHDNRNNIQLTGEYFGNGQQTRTLGRRLTQDEANQHRSEVSIFLKHHGREVTDSFFHSNYMLSHDAKEIPTVESRRFPRRYKTPSEGQIELDTSTTDQFTIESGKIPHKTSTQVLVSSGEPYLKKNNWKYAYNSNGKYDIYPKVWGDRCPTHYTTYKPRALPVISDRITRQCNSNPTVKMM